MLVLALDYLFLDFISLSIVLSTFMREDFDSVDFDIVPHLSWLVSFWIAFCNFQKIMQKIGRALSCLWMAAYCLH